MWAAITAVSCLAIAAVIALVGGLFFRMVSFLQPVLIPVAVAGILSYLIEPVVCWLERLRFSRLWAVVMVFLLLLLGIVGLSVWVAPAVWKQGTLLAANFPDYLGRMQKLANRTLEEVRKFGELPILQRNPEARAEGDLFAEAIQRGLDEALNAAQKEVPKIALALGRFVQSSIGGFLGAFGTLLSMILVPILLFFFLKEGPSISKNWSNYLPLRASPLKQEIVSLLSEINRYLINFFRGQLLVSMIDGAVIALLLLLLGLDFALLIGLMVAFLGIVPYAGVILSWFPAVIIATAQFGDWLHPALVTGIFLLVNNLDGILIAPKIVGDSVGLHPITVILSVFAWSLIFGGLLGALVAVPLTATLKVVLKRYFWERQVACERTMADGLQSPAVREEIS